MFNFFKKKAMSKNDKNQNQGSDNKPNQKQIELAENACKGFGWQVEKDAIVLTWEQMQKCCASSRRKRALQNAQKVTGKKVFVVDEIESKEGEDK